MLCFVSTKMQRSLLLVVVWIVACVGVAGAATGAEQEVVSAWSEQVLEWDELTRCIRGSETGNAIERWLDCLESLEGAPVAPQQPELVDEGAMAKFDPLSSLDGDQGLGFGGEEAMEADRPAQEMKSFAGVAASPVRSEDPVTEVDEVDETEMSEKMEVSEKNEVSASLENSDEGLAADVRGLSSKWGTDFSTDSLPSSDGGGLEVVPEATTAASSTKRSLNLLDALKLAACLGAAVTLMWKKRGRGEQKQPSLRERASEYPCQSGTGFSLTGLSSSNTGAGYPNVMAGSLSTPLGMAIATVMAEQVLEQEHREKTPRSADELSKLLEAAMTESLLPVMGSECTGFVEQFKQSFRSTYRLLGTVRNASRNSAPPAAPNYSRSHPQRGPSRRYSRRTDDEEDDFGGLTSSSRGAYLFPVSESDSRLRDPDSEAELAEQLSKLTVSSANGGSRSSTIAKGSRSDGENSLSHIDHGDFDDVSSPLRREGFSEKGVGVSGSQVHPNGGRSRWGSGGLEHLANVWGSGEGAASQQISRNQGDSSLESDRAMQPFGVIPSGQLVMARSESGLSHHEGETHYKQRKIVLMEQEMHLRKMELAYKFRDLNLKEASLHLSSETNSLMKENVDLSRNKAEFKEAEYQERKLISAYAVFAKRCADEMVAGLCVMLCALFFGAWKYSYDRLVDVVSVCQPTLYEPSNSYVPGFNKVINSLNLMTSKLHMFACEVTVASRMFLGLGIISVVAASLLRKSVTSNSQAMPATILVVVLGGICGFAGKFAVDSMGGSGYHWLLLWEIFCLVHTAATCFTGPIYRVLHGAPVSATGKMHRQPYLMQPWFRLFWFHFTTVLVLPILTGLLPFAHVREILEVLGSNLWNLTYSPLQSYLRKNYQFSLV